MKAAFALCAGFAAAALTTVVAAAEISVEQGGRLARQSCSSCHSVEKSGASPMAIARPFREIAKTFPLDHLGEAFAQGIVTAHPTMPQFMLDDAQVGDLVAYFRSLLPTDAK